MGLSRRLRIGLAVGAIAALAASGCGQLDRDAVQTEIGRAASAGAEGSLVAEQAARARAPKSFIEIRTAELHGVAEKSEEKLSTPVEVGLARSARAGSKLAARVRIELGSLHDRPEDRHRARKVEARLKRISAALRRLEAGL